MSKINLLFRSKLEIDNLKESHGRIKEATWACDKAASNCSQCEAPFSVSRRKVRSELLIR